MTEPIVYICYSKEDEKEKNRLVSHLGVLQKSRLIKTWSDDQIDPGVNWKKEIDQAMAQATIAILLISADFLNSDFILETEVPTLLKRHQHEGLVIFPVIVKACAWKAVDWLTQMNVRPKNEIPVWDHNGRHVDKDLANIAEELAAFIKPTQIQPAPYRILVVDDDPSWQRILKNVLKEISCTVVSANDYAEAKEYLTAPPEFDLTTIDLELDPSIEFAEGLELVSQIRKTFGDQFPIIIVTGEGDLDRQRRAFKDYNVIDFIEKAKLDFHEFKVTVIEAISSSRR